MPEVNTVPIHLDESTNLHYIKGIKHTLFENGVLVDKITYDTRDAKHRSTADLIATAKMNQQNCGWDFEHAVKTAVLRKAGSTKKEEITPEVPVQKKAKDPKVIVTERKEPVSLLETLPSKLTRAKVFFSAPHTDIIVMMLVVGVLCVLMSIYHTNLFLRDSGRDPTVSLIAAVAMVIYSASAYTAARHILQDVGIGFLARLFFAGFLIVTGSFVIMYSVFSTVNVTYAQYKVRYTTAVEVAVKKDTTVSANEDLIALKDKAIADADKEVAGYERDSDRFYADMNKPLPAEEQSEDPAAVAASKRRIIQMENEKYAASKNYVRSQTQLESSRAARKKLVEEREALSKEKVTVVAKATESQETAYTMVARRLGITEDSLQFVIYVIPAAFFDVVAPFALAIVLLLKDRRNSKVVVERKKSILERLVEVVNAKTKG